MNLAIRGEVHHHQQNVGSFTVHTFWWTSSAAADPGGAGNVEYHLENLEGVPYRLVTQPLNTPTADYDITLLDELGNDALLTKGGNRSASDVQTVGLYESTTPELRHFVQGRHRLVIANAGDTKRGKIVLHMFTGPHQGALRL